uniref:PiggyBac transposable element-derived protein domain-containing protein n=1 Tax=Homalodisca liturata TaxID=320908 RepID=A0A1B6JQP1_9HEMI
MNRNEEERLVNLLNSVEREERQEEERLVNPGAIRRQLFLDEPVVAPIGELDSDDEDEDHVSVQEEDTASEQSGEEAEVPFLEASPEYTGKDGVTKWSVHCPRQNVRTPADNLVRGLPGVRQNFDVQNPVAAWRLFFTDEVLDSIVTCTNQRIRKVRPGYTRERDAADTSRNEIEAFIGLLYMAGILRASHLNLYDLWATDGTGVEFFRNCMNLRRFKFLIRVLRFDDADTRKHRKRLDRLAPIRDLFELLVEKCKTNFSVSEYLTVDEMLESFRGRCKFRQFIKNKPAKYGLKIHALTCARTFYTMNLEVYAGKQPPGPFQIQNSGLAVVSRLVQPVSGTGRNITTDNWYTSIPLAETLKNDHNLTLVGTLRKNKKEIPLELIDTRNRPVSSSMFAFKDGKTLLSYCPKKKKVVLLLSTMHHSDEIDPQSGDAKKPFILTFYNSTKGGVDVVDEYKARYSVARTSNRWPLTIFFSLLNTIGLNSYIVYKHKRGDFDIVRREFLKDLAKDLCFNYLVARHGEERLPRQLKRSITQMLGLQEEERPQPAANLEGRCGICNWRKNRKSKTTCHICHKYICREHTVFTCSQCAEEDNDDSTSD